MRNARITFGRIKRVRRTTPVYVGSYIYIYTRDTCKYLGAYYTHYYLLCVYDRKKNIILYGGTRLSVRAHTQHTSCIRSAAVTGPDHSLYFIILRILYRYNHTGAADTSRVVITHSGAV